MLNLIYESRPISVVLLKNFNPPFQHYQTRETYKPNLRHAFKNVSLGLYYIKCNNYMF